ncbi:4Fe-4S dicluster domain-containing protein [Sphaerobacter thermophilus]|jgi:Fe-S-cluster-containing hydrogenase components 1|uniref:4Fe-4S ferredoxin iron-sulfur binding domain protein n=1 Tax=Sphaerobacter thermophilus (strain ATCC 49802 / DSM 20745 / KCCM 41009 / NCIMB 13125 / S 6022) TaxID=479434 RepID=D1C6G4_SPHTD|nr:4Fe-4S dicluster domain-containing protein [Sphaerobacter thermophilus]ACZ39589.1 4Fe-4S ferredoxin iron-sulfur binding domain protein [Sphaerobacter thermophilus DSM 20745]PZN61335.1 MAG: 4Fe-4S dicluster domain-containing protein [Sphaerobacter thermophilus]
MSPRWGMVIDLDRCTGCQACVVACQAENNIPINTEAVYLQHRAIEWIRVERYWDGEYPNIKARYIPVPCMHCSEAPCEPVCPVYATYHTPEGINMQVYNRCIGTRYCAVNCHWHVRFFNFWEPKWPESLQNQLNPNVSVRSRGVMEKCTFCIQRINNAEQNARLDGGRPLRDGEVNTACAQACPTRAIVFGDLDDPESQVAQIANTTTRGYKVLAELGTNPSVLYLKKIDPEAPAHGGAESA